MDQDLIKLVNKLQDTFSNLGTLHSDLTCNILLNPGHTGGELDMPQLIVVRRK